MQVYYPSSQIVVFTCFLSEKTAAGGGVGK